jgi:hypothetical protein
MYFTASGEEKNYNELYDLYPLPDIIIIIIIIRVTTPNSCGGLTCITTLKHYCVFDALVCI